MATNHGQRRLIMMPPVQVTDDHLFGVDGPRWCPRGNPACEPLTPEGWPWFGDGVEVLISTHGGRPHSTVAGNASQAILHQWTPTVEGQNFTNQYVNLDLAEKKPRGA